MNDSAAAIRAYFTKLGLESEIADIYLALHTYGPQGISGLSRHAGVERTRIYRLLDHLTNSGLVEVETHYKRSLYKAAPISNLRILISQKEQELRNLTADLAAIEQVFVDRSLNSPATRVQFYQGLDGVKQMFWNETKAQSEILGIFYENMQIKANSAFFERWVDKFNTRNLRVRGLISDEFIGSQQTWYAMHHNERLKNWRPRYVPKSLMPITHSQIIYDNVIAYYNWKDNEIFGVEVYNQDIADTQRHLFEMLWGQSKDVDDLIGP